MYVNLRALMARGGEKEALQSIESTRSICQGILFLTYVLRRSYFFFQKLTEQRHRMEVVISDPILLM